MNRLATGFLLAALCVSPLAVSAQQGQSTDAPPTRVQQMPPNSMQQGAPPQGSPPQYQGVPQFQPAVPPTLTLPAGTIIAVRTMGFLSSNRNKAGDGFNATLAQPLVADGWVVVRRGQTVMGRVVLAQKVKGTSQLGVELGELVLVDGQQVPLKTELIQNSGGNRPVTGGDVAAVGATTGVGAIIGGAAGGGAGAGIGAGVGVMAGLAGVMLTRGHPAVVYPETLLSFKLDAPVTISTEKSQVAFQPVSQDDYGVNQQRSDRPQRMVYGGGGYGGYGYPYYYAPYPYYYGFYPGPFFFGYGGGYRFGGGFRGGRR
jgi:hypothetical protein